MSGRVFQELAEAIGEIKRDVYKGIAVSSSRVQQRVDEELPGRERLGYLYTIMGGFPITVLELMDLGKEFEFPMFLKDPDGMKTWLYREWNARLEAVDHLGVSLSKPSEEAHPALKTTFEGNWPAYTYNERLYGAMEAMHEALERSPDSRRAYWPIFRPEDSLRAGAPTRIPCSLGYQALIRKVGDSNKLLFYYMSRSVDYDTFWLTDIWLARQFQVNLAERLDQSVGSITHFITSFHSFTVENTEVY